MLRLWAVVTALLIKNASPEQIKAAMDWLEYLGVSVKLTDDKKESLKKIPNPRWNADIL